MNAEPLAQWTLDDVKAYCRRFGLTLSEPQLLRMHELSTTVSATGMGIPRMPSKDHEPALTFAMPKE
ncbi:MULTISPECIES: hypothetical protein [unclassified Bordetella]|uniref:hypothetical protein n=1 Tax=unclassified Bordetella TaxID=2630031 RepID=UPI001325A130|nr:MULTISPECIES: hypothetical protein [unclassified Bordetella]MVW70372.1 hypothetical protein [Bordetella sp. 15P40C-2]MVW78146.1 hypothetical protein [Bordetella sp. 02P26C-1]